MTAGRRVLDDDSKTLASLGFKDNQQIIISEVPKSVSSSGQVLTGQSAPLTAITKHSNASRAPAVIANGSQVGGRGDSLLTRLADDVADERAGRAALWRGP